MPVTINGTTGITTPDLDSTADITANSVPFGEGGGSVTTNTAAGIGSLNSNTSGSANTAYGNNALNLNTTGNDNTAIGRLALLNATTGSGNTACGENAGNSMTTGAKNTLIGRYNGNQGGLDIRTASNNIVLSDGDGNPRIQVDSSGNVNMPTTLISQQAGVYTTNNVFSIGASTNVRVQVNIGNYGFIKFRIYGLRTNGGNSVVWWEGVLNNNDNTSYTNTQTQQTSGGNISFTLSSPSSGVWNFDFNNAGSGGTGWYDKQDYGSGSVTVTTY
jgi:hypothetical protein